MRKLAASFALLVSLLLCLSPPTSIYAGEAKAIIGSDKAGVDTLLAGWESHKSGLASGDQLAYDYQKDVNLTVWFKAGKASSVAVTDRGSAIPEARYQQLLTLIGGQPPKPEDVFRDPNGIRSFSVGNTE
jgi:hypothetical protein